MSPFRFSILISGPPLLMRAAVKRSARKTTLPPCSSLVRGVERHGGDGKVAVDAAVERLEAEVGGKAAREEEIDVAVDGLEAGIFLRIAAEADFYGAVDGVREAGAGHAVEFDVAIDVARHEVAVDVADDDAAFVDGAQIDV